MEYKILCANSLMLVQSSSFQRAGYLQRAEALPAAHSHAAFIWISLTHNCSWSLHHPQPDNTGAMHHHVTHLSHTVAWQSMTQLPVCCEAAPNISDIFYFTQNFSHDFFLSLLLIYVYFCLCEDRITYVHSCLLLILTS